MAGVLISILIHLYKTSRPHMAVVGQVPGTEHYRNIRRHKVITDDRVLTVRVDESLYFANARNLEDRIYDLVAERPALELVILMCPAVNAIDFSALESLEAINERLGSLGVTFHLSEVKGPVMDRLERSDFKKHLTGRIFLSQHQAMKALTAAPPARSSWLSGQWWRRGRDSNPRYHLWYTPLAGERLQPLGHLSGPARN